MGVEYVIVEWIWGTFGLDDCDQFHLGWGEEMVDETSLWRRGRGMLERCGGVSWTRIWGEKAISDGVEEGEDRS